MKKTYITPETEITLVGLSSIIAMSGNGVDDEGNVDIPRNPGTGNGDDAAVKRGFNVWGNDDWDE